MRTNRSSSGAVLNAALYKSGAIHRLLMLWILLTNAARLAGRFRSSLSLAIRVVHSSQTWRKIRRMRCGLSCLWVLQRWALEGVQGRELIARESREDGRRREDGKFERQAVCSRNHWRVGIVPGGRESNWVSFSVSSALRSSMSWIEGADMACWLWLLCCVLMTRRM